MNGFRDYLAQFKKTVAMHEVFLQRIAAHPVFRQDSNFRIFLQYEDELSVRGKNKKEVVESLWKRLTQSADEVLLSGQRDVDDFFENERNYLVEYNTHIKDAATKAEKVVKLRKSEHRIFLVVNKLRWNLDDFLGYSAENAGHALGSFDHIICVSLEEEKFVQLMISNLKSLIQCG
ncbi:unnamed protein product [Haemonchus placei]|uniref:PX domain-containing protein n=1 Tax=Haemonchus placei TaxID=6290 RepID=A0A0N4X9M3_HAEPC|nr:unnamed protein product [Haemonchus placei]